MVTINSLDEATRIMELTKLAMDNNPTIAAIARITKDLFPIVEKVFSEEFERDHDNAIIGLSNFIQGIIVNKVILDKYCGHPECSRKMMISIKELFISNFDNTIKELPNILDETMEEKT